MLFSGVLMTWSLLPKLVKLVWTKTTDSAVLLNAHCGNEKVTHASVCPVVSSSRKRDEEFLFLCLKRLERRLYRKKKSLQQITLKIKIGKQYELGSKAGVENSFLRWVQAYGFTTNFRNKMHVCLNPLHKWSWVNISRQIFYSFKSWLGVLMISQNSKPSNTFA